MWSKFDNLFYSFLIQFDKKAEPRKKDEVYKCMWGKFDNLFCLFLIQLDKKAEPRKKDEVYKCMWGKFDNLFYSFLIQLDKKAEPRKKDEDAVPHEEVDPRERRDTNCTIFLGYTSNLISSGLRETLRFLAQHNLVSWWKKVMHLFPPN